MADVWGDYIFPVLWLRYLEPELAGYTEMSS